MEDILGYKFKDKDHLKKALSHPSYIANIAGAQSYERMEFLGDSILGVVISDMLYHKFPKEQEGGLAKRRAALVCGKTLAEIARSIDLGKHLMLSAGEEKNGGRENDANLENAFEAMIAAIYLDGGMEPTKAFILTHFEKRAENMIATPRDPKSSLQEMLQARGLPVPIYKTVAQSGPPHAPIFTIEIQVEGCSSVQAEGSSKREAERKSAELFLTKIATAFKNDNIT